MPASLAERQAAYDAHAQAAKAAADAPYQRHLEAQAAQRQRTLEAEQAQQVAAGVRRSELQADLACARTMAQQVESADPTDLTAEVFEACWRESLRIGAASLVEKARSALEQDERTMRGGR